MKPAPGLLLPLGMLLGAALSWLCREYEPKIEARKDGPALTLYASPLPQVQSGVDQLIDQSRRCTDELKRCSDGWSESNRSLHELVDILNRDGGQ